MREHGRGMEERGSFVGGEWAMMMMDGCTERTLHGVADDNLRAPQTSKTCLKSFL